MTVSKKMKGKLLTILAVWILSICVLDSNASALGFGDKTIDIGVEAGFLSKYVWRGVVPTDGPVFQSSFTAGFQGLSLNFWDNMDIDDVNGQQSNFTEFDYTLGYSTSYKMLGFSTGVIHYYFPRTGGSATTELYFGACVEVTGSPSLTLYQDVDDVEGTYVSLEAGMGLPVGVFTTLDISGALGFGSKDHNEAYYGEASGGLADVFIGVSALFGIGEIITISPSIAFSSIINGDIRDAIEENDGEPMNVVFGITASVGF